MGELAIDLRAPAPRDDLVVVAGAGLHADAPQLIRLAAALTHRGLEVSIAGADWPLQTFALGAGLLVLLPAPPAPAAALADPAGDPANESAAEPPAEPSPAQLANAAQAWLALTERTCPVLPVAVVALPPGRASEAPAWLAAGFDDAAVLAADATDAELDALAARAAARLRARPVRGDLALHDALTGLATPPVFFSQLGPVARLASRTRQPLAVAVVDLDGFVALEQALGRDVAREVLRDAADQLRATLRRSDLIARLGDDRFGLILHHIGAFAARRLLHKLWQSLSVRKETADKMGALAGKLTFTAGVAICPDNGTDGRELYTRAELALDVARATGQRRVLLYSEAAADSGLDLAGTDLRWHRTGDGGSREPE